MRTALLTITTLAALAAGAAPADAQVALIPKVGAFSPSGDLGDFDGNTQELEGSFAVGLAAEFGLPVLPFDIRAGFDYATDTKVTREGLGDAGSAPNATLLALTADAVIRGGSGILQPYFLFGGGIKRYDISEDELRSGNQDVILDEDQSDFAGHVGAGLALGLGIVSVTFEVSDYISQFEAADGNSELQNDLFFMLGARIGF